MLTFPRRALLNYVRQTDIFSKFRAVSRNFSRELGFFRILLFFDFTKFVNGPGCARFRISPSRMNYYSQEPCSERRELIPSTRELEMSCALSKCTSTSCNFVANLSLPYEFFRFASDVCRILEWLLLYFMASNQRRLEENNIGMT